MNKTKGFRLSHKRVNGVATSKGDNCVISQTRLTDDYISRNVLSD